jgi:hypothetical protein
VPLLVFTSPLSVLREFRLPFIPPSSVLSELSVLREFRLPFMLLLSIVFRELRVPFIPSLSVLKVFNVFSVPHVVIGAVKVVRVVRPPSIASPETE